MLKVTQPLYNNVAGRLVTPSLNEIPAFLKGVEGKWYRKLMLRFSRQSHLPSKKTRYILSMFPYPSGRLHLGHVRIYTSGDILARFSRMLARNDEYSEEFNNVIHPMGFDSFGLPAENAARERGLNPANWTKNNIMTMKKQLDDLALQFNWREATSNPTYYKWTQQLFLKLMDANLVYKSYAKVNWDPIDQTVLANEQVDSEGRSWRSGSQVEKRYCRQWFVKTNAFTNDIYDADEVEPESWRDVLLIQRGWIGKPNGWIFYIPTSDSSDSDIMPIFSQKPELFLRDDVTLVLAKDHWLEKVLNISEKGYIKNPFNQSKLKVMVTDAFTLPEGSNATLMTGFDLGSEVINKDQFDRIQVLKLAKLLGYGGYRTSDKYRDWLVSRQRFWGTPIPVVKCPSCGYRGVATSELPVKLPELKDISANKENLAQGLLREIDEYTIPTPIDKLAPIEWLKGKCPTCNSEDKTFRETETLDTLFDSSWYFLRYVTCPNKDAAFDQHYVQQVNTYIGGLEHASMHLFYARFITHFLHSLGELKFREPFKKLLVQGVVKSKTYKSNGRYITKEEYDRLKSQNDTSLECNYEKMSKSKGNGIDPEDLLSNYGIDATRFCLMSYANPRTERLWRTNQEEFKEVFMFLRRVILTVQEYCDVGYALKDKSINVKIKELNQHELDVARTALVDSQNNCSRKAIYHLQNSYQFRQYISVLHVLINVIRNNMSSSVIYTNEFAEALASFIIMLSPMTPHLCEELWQHFGKSIINPLKEFETASFKTILLASDQRWPIPNRIKESPQE